MTGMSPGRRRGCRLAVHDLDGLAELGDRGGLPGPGRPGHDQPAPPGDRRGGSGTDSLRPSVMTCRMTGVGDDQEPGVVAEPVLVVGEPLVVPQAAPGLLGQQVRDRRARRRRTAASRRSVVSCRAPPRASAPCRAAAGVRSPALVRFAERVEDRHRDHLRQRRVLVRRLRPGPRLRRAAGRRARSGGLPGGVAALVRAATRRSRLRIFGFSARRALRRPGAAAPATASAISASVASRPQAAAGMVPGQLAERDRRPVQVRPEHGDPPVRVADADPGDVVGVVADLPQVLLRAVTPDGCIRSGFSSSPS